MNEIIDVIEMLSHSQGFYGRLLRSIQELKQEKVVIMMLSKKDLKIVLCCIGLVVLGFVYDNACDYVMDIIDRQKEEQTSELEHSNHVMRTIEKDIYNACGLDPYCGDLFIEV